MNLVYPLSAGWAYCTWGDTLCLTITEVERLKGHAAFCGDSLCRVLLYFKKGNAMKKMSMIVLLVAASVAVPAMADSTKDARVDKVLSEIGLKYAADTDGDAKLTLGGLDNDRTQLMWVNADTNILSEYESRDIWTIAYLSDKPLPDDKAKMLLEKNAGYKIGSWSLKKFGSKYAAVFTAKIPANAEKTAVRAAIMAVAITGDKMELELTGKDDL